MFRVTRQIDFCYGHRLMNYDGKCKYLHGHNGRAIIAIEAREPPISGLEETTVTPPSSST